MNYFKMGIYLYILIFTLGISLLTIFDLKKECAYYGFTDYKISIYLEKYCLLEINRTKITIPLKDLYNIDREFNDFIPSTTNEIYL